MNNTLAFAKLDFLTIKPYITAKTILLLLCVFGFIGYSTGEPYTLIGMLMMYSMIYASYPFAMGDRNGIDTLYATLPITKKNIVVGRYVFALCLNVCVSVATLVVSMVLMTVLEKAIGWQESLLTVAPCFIVVSIIEAVQLPIYFKLGYSKAKFLAYLPLMLIPALIFVISKLSDGNSLLTYVNNIFIWMEANVFITVICIAVVWSLIMFISGLLSYQFYKKREF